MTNDRDQSENRRNREPMWSIPPGWWTAFSALFIIQVSFVSTIVGLDEVRHGDQDRRFAEILSAVLDRLSAVPLVAVAFSMVLLEGVKTIMVIGQYLENKLVKPLQERLREEGRTEGVAKTHEEWADWNRRRLEADERGLPFNEPPPQAPSQVA